MPPTEIKLCQHNLQVFQKSTIQSILNSKILKSLTLITCIVIHCKNCFSNRKDVKNSWVWHFFYTSVPSMGTHAVPCTGCPI